MKGPGVEVVGTDGWFPQLLGVCGWFQLLGAWVDNCDPSPVGWSFVLEWHTVNGEPLIDLI